MFKESYRASLKGTIEKIGYDCGVDLVELKMPLDHIHIVVKSESNGTYLSFRA